MKVSLVIPNWNGRHLLEKNLPGWLAMGADEMIIVDDDSTDGSVNFLKRLKTKELKKLNFQLIENKKNLGFAKAVNKGVERALGDIVVLLNTDVRPEPGLLPAILPHFRDPKVFGVSFAEWQWSWARGNWKNGFVEHEPGPRTNAPHPTFWVSGGSGAFRKSIWDELGGFDPIYLPFYWEDVDLSYRALKRGYKLIWEPKARVAHEHEATIGKYFSADYKNFIQERNQLLFIWKNITSQRLTREHLGGVIRRILLAPGYLRVVMGAMGKIGEIAKKREKEKKQMVISDEEIFKEFS